MIFHRLLISAALFAASAMPINAEIIIDTNGLGNYQIIRDGVTLSVEMSSTYDNVIETSITLGTGDDAVRFDSVESYYTQPIVRFIELDLSNDTPEILLSAYSGDENCCHELIAYSNVDNTGWEAITIGSFDASTTPETVIDMDGDGTAEIPARDTRFLSQFASYADSFTPPQYWGLLGNIVIDKTKAPAFADYVQAEIDGLGPIPETGAARNSWLASYAAMLLILGQDDPLDYATSAFDESVDWGMMQCRDKTITEGECPEDQMINIGYEAALSDFLTKTGYLKANP